MEENKQLENPLWAHLAERIDAIERLGVIWAKSGHLKADRVEQGQIAVAYCMSAGISMLEFLATYHPNMEGPSKRALACLAQFRQRGGNHKWLTEPEDQEKATLECSYEGKTLKVTFDIKDAKQQGLVRPNSNWVKTPSNMLRARAITNLIGMLAPEIVAGAEAAPDDAPSVPPKELELGPKPQPEQKEQKTNEEAEREMGLAPATKSDPAGEKIAEQTSAEKVAAKPKAAKSKRTSISKPGPEADENTGPIPPPATIEPEGGVEPPKSQPGPELEIGNEELSPDIVNEMGHIFRDNFLKVALWMIKEKWIPAASQELKTEGQASAHLQVALPNLPKAKAKRILTKKLAFMRAVETIEP